MIMHRRKGQLTVTFSEIHSFVVQAFNVTHIISDGSLFLHSEPEKPVKKPKVRDPENDDSDEDDSDDDDEREIVITTRTFSIKIITGSIAQAAEIRTQIFGNAEGLISGNQDTTTNGGKTTMANQDQSKVKATSTVNDA
jgi:hypothetical protein